MTKNEVRDVMLEKRLSLSPEEVEEVSKVIQDRCIKSPLWPKKGRIGLYAPVKNEVMTQTIFQKALEAGLHVYFPHVEQGIRFYEVDGPDDLQRGSWSIPEPKKHCVARKKEHHFDLLIIPGIAFSKDCHRIGYGRGFYDKFISKLIQDSPTIALAYDFQIVDSFPLDEWDEPLSGIMTEKNFLHPRKMTSQNLNILYIGDIFGEPGRRAVKHFVPKLIDQHDVHLVLANCENAAKGRGISKRLVGELLESGIDFLTSGNHVFKVHDIYPYLNDSQTRLLRPYNLSRNSPGKGIGIAESKTGVRVGVINIMGRLFMEPGVDLPFDAVDQAILELQQEVDVLVLDMHAETTSEKRAMGWHVDGRVQLDVGTHTHVQTADEEILPQGTAYITDLGMCGPYDSVIGMDKGIILKRFRTALPEKFDIGTNDIRLCGVICEIDVHQKRAVSIKRICERLGD